MLSIKTGVNVPSIVVGVGLAFVLMLNLADWRHKASLAEVAAAKQETVTRLLVDR